MASALTLPAAAVGTPTTIILHLDQTASIGWTSVLQWLIPAGIAAGVALLVLWVNTNQTAAMHKERLKGDRELAEWKAAEDLTLAERKIALDREFADWKRRAEIAEQTLALFHEVRDAIRWSRGRGMFRGEGENRAGRDEEPPELRQRRDLYSVPIERLNAAESAISRLRALRYVFIAYFGLEVSQPFTDLLAVINEIRSSAFTLLEIAHAESFSTPQSYIDLKRRIWGADGTDELDERLDRAMAAIDSVCQAALQGRPKSLADALPSALA